LPREAVALVVVVTLAFAVYTLDLMSWRYAFIGDEYAFYEFANNIIRGFNRPYLLSPRGAYDVHPVFATFVQVATITLYGNDIYGWRISETLAIMLAGLPLYVFARTFVNARAALLAVIVYLSSQHVLGLSKVGYTYSQLFVPLLGALALCALALKRGSWLGIYLCGVASAFAFYTFAFGIPFIALPLLLLAMYGVPVGAKPWRAAAHALPLIAIFILGVGLTALPSLSDAEALQRIAGHTVANSEVKTTNNLTEQVIPNVLYTATASLAFLGHSHYVSGAHLDPLASLLMLLGVASIIAMLRRQRFAWWLLISFGLVCVFVGGFAPYPYPPIARTYILLPYYGLFVALGATALASFVRHARARLVLWLLFMLAIPALNLYQFFTLTDGVNPQEDIPLIVKEFQEQPNVSAFYVVTRPPFNANVTRMILRAYNLDADKLVVVSDENPNLSLPAIKRSGKGDYVVLLLWHMPSLDRWRAGLRAQWPSLSATPLSDGTDLIHFAKLAVSANVSDGATVTPPPSSAP
ncbi:MAG: glycosyltransferase family 39 protein, partial [Chloroflexota bacterium]